MKEIFLNCWTVILRSLCTAVQLVLMPHYMALYGRPEQNSLYHWKEKCQTTRGHMLFCAGWGKSLKHTFLLHCVIGVLELAHKYWLLAVFKHCICDVECRTYKLSCRDVKKQALFNSCCSTHTVNSWLYNAACLLLAVVKRS